MKNFLLVLVSTFLSFTFLVFVIEVFLGFRYEQWKSQYAKDGDWYGGLTTVSKNPTLMWEYRPYAESAFSPKVRTNRYGFRDDDYESAAKPTDIFRISFIGDSVTLGLKVDSQSSFVKKIEGYAAENNPDPKIQSMNHGIDGYNAIQVSELLTTRVLQFEPDKVVYVMCLNDFDFEDSSGGKLTYFKKPRSFTWKLFERVYRYIRGIDFHIWHFEKNKREVFSNIIGTKRLLQERNIDFQIVILPVFDFAFEDSDNDFSIYSPYEMHLAIREFLTKEQIEFIDLLEPFKNQENPPSYFAYDIWHPNEEGHDFISKQLLPFVLRGI